MKERFTNFQRKMKRKNVIRLLAGAAVLTVSQGTLTGCSAPISGQAASSVEESGIVQAAPGVEESGIVQVAPGGEEPGVVQAAPGVEEPGIVQAAPGREESGSGQAAPEEGVSVIARDMDASVYLTDEMSLTDQGKTDSLFWSLDGVQETGEENVLTFSTGLQLILPAEWGNRVAVSAVPDESGNGEMLILSTKDEAEEGISIVLFYLRYVCREGFDADDPYSIYGRETDRVLGVYDRDGMEYALIFEVPQLYYQGVDGQAFNKILHANRDIFESVSEARIVTEKMQDFTECGLEDLDWIVSWQSTFTFVN